MPDHVPAVAETLVDRILALAPERLPKNLPERLADKCEDLAVDVIGLTVAARNEDYVKAALAGCDDDGPCTATGHPPTLSAAAAPPSSTPPRRTARFLTTRSRAAGCMRAP